MTAGHLPSWREEEGAASLEVVLVMPVLILIITLAIQFALWSHATHVAVAAAQDGTQAARVEGGSAEAGEARAADFLAQTAPRLIASPVITARRDAGTATVVVRGNVASLLGGLRLRVQGRASGPVERFRSDVEGPR
jgi:Flp pilus assembly protein TadG